MQTITEAIIRVYSVGAKTTISIPVCNTSERDASHNNCNGSTPVHTGTLSVHRTWNTPTCGVTAAVQ